MDRMNYHWVEARSDVLYLQPKGQRDHRDVDTAVAAVYFDAHAKDPNEPVLVNIWPSADSPTHPDSYKEYASVDEAKAACEAALWPDAAPQPAPAEGWQWELTWIAP